MEVEQIPSKPSKQNDAKICIYDVGLLIFDFMPKKHKINRINTVEYIDAFCEHAKTFAVKNACRTFGTLHL